MVSTWLLAALHLLGFGFALTAIVARTWALRRARDSAASLRGMFAADSLWGVTAVVLIVTGLMRAFGGFEKGGAYYLHAPLFHLKMAALVLILLLEIAPMMALIRWRIAVKKGGAPDLARAGRFATISAVQALLLIVMVLAATGMARGIGS